jgi:hypothetical protein
MLEICSRKKPDSPRGVTTQNLFFQSKISQRYRNHFRNEFRLVLGLLGRGVLWEEKVEFRRILWHSYVCQGIWYLHSLTSRLQQICIEDDVYTSPPPSQILTEHQKWRKDLKKILKNYHDRRTLFQCYRNCNRGNFFFFLRGSRANGTTVFLASTEGHRAA